MPTSPAAKVAGYGYSQKACNPSDISPRGIRQTAALTGALFFLGKETPLHGTVDAQGRCRLEGTIQTLLRTFAFTAEGHLEDRCLELMPRGPFASLTMTGVSQGPETR